MAPRVLLFVFLLATGCFIAGAHAQTSNSGTSATTSSGASPSKASASDTKKEMRAAKKAERIAKRKKRAQCYDQAKKEKVADKDLTRFLADCNKK